MSRLIIQNREIESVFQLLGTKENDISFSVGYALANSDNLLSNLLDHLNINKPKHFGNVQILLQRYEAKGFTDFEIICNDFHIIIEAKRGWTFPSEEQLSKYGVDRPTFSNSLAQQRILVVFNESNEAFTKTHFNILEIGGISVKIVSWQAVRRLANQALQKAKLHEKRMLNQLIIYLNKISTMQNIYSNDVYVVSLGKGNFYNTTWKDIVYKHSKYFHPVGGGIGGWPIDPPNYIAFRFDGMLQSIHHINSYEVIRNTEASFGIKHTFESNHFLYSLGPAIKPSKVVSSGTIVRSGRVWAMLDLLLTCSTISEANERSKARKSQPQ